MIYLIKSNEYLKIGYTNNLDSRTKAYNTHNPDYEIIGTKPGTKTDETRLHKLCRNYHYDKEWFYDTPYVREVFETYESFHKTTKSENEITDFYMTFIDYVKWIYGLTTITTLKVLYKLLEIAEYNTGEVSLSPGKRQEIMESIGIKKSAFTQALNQLVESGALEVKYKLDNTGNIIIGKNGEPEIVRGEYRISPEMFWKGELKKRAELKVTFETKYLDDFQTDEF